MKFSLFTFLFLVLILNLKAQRPTPNYIEAKVPRYILPEVLRTAADKAVNNKNDWERIRRPEILTLFENNIYGQMPGSYDSIKYATINEDKTSMNGRAHLKEVLIEVFNNNKSVKINLVLFVPSKATKPVPVFLLINNRPKENMDPTRNQKSEFWPAEILIDSGYAIAAFHNADVAPDNKDTYGTGVLQMYPDQLNADNGMRAIGAWAWAASRVMDYFESEPLINKNRVAVVGHSRGGKASLWAAAQDQRFAMCFTNNSGNTGAALARRRFGETVAVINTSFPHWFTPNYKRYNNKEDELPVDQHMLISLIAPRPVYATNASKDLWADPRGTYLSLKNAEKVYALYGKRSKLPKEPPGINKPVVESPIAYHNREGEHNLKIYDWNNFIKFADYHYGIKR